KTSVMSPLAPIVLQRIRCTWREGPVIMTLDPGGGSTVELDRLSNSKVAAVRFRNGCSSGNFLGRRNHGLPKESQYFIDTSYRYLPFDRASGALTDALLCW